MLHTPAIQLCRWGNPKSFSFRKPREESKAFTSSLKTRSLLNFILEARAWLIHEEAEEELPAAAQLNLHATDATKERRTER